MPDWFPRSVFGAVLAGVYVVAAVVAVAVDRAPGSGGGWISLNGMISFLATLPVSAACEVAGMKLDFRRNADMTFAILSCAVMIYFLGAGLEKLARMIFAVGHVR